MKNSSSHGQIPFKSCLLPVGLMLAGALAIVGCSKTAVVSTPPPSVEQDTNNPAAVPVYTRPATTTVVATPPNGEPDLKAMTHSLRGWIARTHRVPANLADYQAQANVQFPTAPSGKKFTLGPRMTVILVSQ